MSDQMQVFYNETVKGFSECGEKIKTQSDLIKKLEDQLNKITLEKAIENERNETLLYKLSVMNDRIQASEQKVNDLNNIMMKHFAYRCLTNQATPVNPVNPVGPTIVPTSVPPIQNTGFTFQQPIGK